MRPFAQWLYGSCVNASIRIHAFVSLVATITVNIHAILCFKLFYIHIYLKILLVSFSSNLQLRKQKHKGNLPHFTLALHFLSGKNIFWRNFTFFSFFVIIWINFLFYFIISRLWYYDIARGIFCFHRVQFTLKKTLYIKEKNLFGWRIEVYLPQELYILTFISV